ncbi:MAG: TolC family protein [Sulfuricella sp.]|nr:TolC family protein [Sulfuricella sp.]
MAIFGLLVSSGGRAGELGELLRDTLHHPQIEAAQSLKNAAQAQQDAATGRYLGSVVASSGWHRYEGIRVVGVYVPGQPGLPLTADRIVQTGVNYSLPVDLFGVIAANRERAKQDVSAAELVSQQQALLKLHQSAAAYLTLRALQKQREELGFYRQRVEATILRVRQEVELGKTAGVEARYAESELARLIADEALLKGNLAQTQAELAEASGRESFLPSVGVTPLPAWEDIPFGDTIPARLAQSREGAARAQADEGRRALLPQVSLDANYFRNSGGGDDRDTWAFGGVISLPLGVSQYQQSAAQKHSAQAAVDQARAALRDAERQLVGLRAAYESANADVSALEKEILYREEVVKVQREMQRLGSQTLENLFRHERDLLDAQFRMAQSQARAVVSWSAAQVIAGMPAETYIAKLDTKK